MSMIDEAFAAMTDTLAAIDEMVKMYSLLEYVGEGRSATWGRLVAAMDEQGIAWRGYGSFAEEAFQRAWPKGYND